MNDQYQVVYHERCECHDCTQARYKSTLQGQIETGMREAAKLLTNKVPVAAPVPTEKEKA